jgi:serine O-acetyltransferase
MYDCPLPDVFAVIHGVGTVLGKAEYHDFLCVWQGCSVGANGYSYPSLGRGVGLGAGSQVIGSCNIGSMVSIGAGTTVVNKNIEDGITVFRNDDGQLVKRTGESLASRVFFANFLNAE